MEPTGYPVRLNGTHIIPVVRAGRVKLGILIRFRVEKNKIANDRLSNNEIVRFIVRSMALKARLCHLYPKKRKITSTGGVFS